MKYLLPIVLIQILSAGCNHLFYYPEKQEYLTPEKVELKFESISFKSGNETLHMWKIPAVSSGRIGKVLHFHGNAQNISTHFLFTAWMARFGFDVYVFDYRGYGKSTGTPDRAGLVEDGMAAVQYVADVDSNDFYIFAQSLGGAVAVPSVALSPRKDMVRALILDSTFDSYRDLARGKLASFWLTWPLQFPLGLLVSDDYSPRDYAGGLTMPLLSVHGTGDTVVPYEIGKQLYDEVPGNRKDFWTLKDAPHTWFLSENSDWHLKFLDYLCGKHSNTAKCQSIVASSRKIIDQEEDED